jgi:glucose/arabinose dehydrogenase
MDYGPFLTGSLDRDRAVSEKHSNESTEQAGNPNALAAKAVIVRVGDKPDDACIAFDTDLLRVAAGWTGGFVNLDKTHLASMKGSVPLAPVGKLAFVTPTLPGWSIGDTFTDPRPRPFGPLPTSVGRYKGLYVHGGNVVFSYSVGDCDVLDRVEFRRGAGNDENRFSRTFHFSPHHTPLTLLVGDHPPGSVRVAPSDQARNLRVPISGTVSTESVEDLSALTHGGPARYPESRITKGALGTGDGAYVVDTLTLPNDNPWKSWMRPSGLDFFSDGRLAVCTLNGDVWVVSGIDESLKELKWRRFATGLYEPLGLKVAKDEVYVLGRDQITRLHDLNGDGEADFYENFNNDAPCSANYHGFAFDLCTDSRGNFYYTRAGQRMHPGLPDHGALLRVSADGSKLEPIAAGLRAANGMAIGPEDLITVADNQGNWTPSSRINVVRPGGFYGYMPHVTAAGGKPRDDYDPPLCWIPTTVDNSSGSQAWTTDAKGRFGPLSNRLFHTSYGRASLMLVTLQKLDDGVYQGGVIPMPFKFASGVMRGRMNPKDGQLYLCGLRGWQTDGAQDGALCRVRYTGKKLYMPTDINASSNGINITFSQPLDPETAEDVGSYGIEQWNYRWTADYGSPDFSVTDPAKQGHDEVTIASAKLRPDRRTVFLAIPGLRPVMQMQIRANVDAADGTTIDHTVYLTINRVPGDKQRAAP